MATTKFKFVNIKAAGPDSQKRLFDPNTKARRALIASEYGYSFPTDVCCGYCKYYNYNLGTGGTNEHGTCRNPNNKLSNRKVHLYNWCERYDFLDYCNCPRVYYSDNPKYQWKAPASVKEVLENSKI